MTNYYSSPKRYEKKLERMLKREKKWKEKIERFPGLSYMILWKGAGDPCACAHNGKHISDSIPLNRYVYNESLNFKDQNSVFSYMLRNQLSLCRDCSRYKHSFFMLTCVDTSNFKMFKVCARCRDDNFVILEETISRKCKGCEKIIQIPPTKEAFDLSLLTLCDECKSLER